MISAKFRIKQERSELLFELLKEKGFLSRPAIVAITGIPRTTVYQSLVPLLRDGRIETFTWGTDIGVIGRPRIMYRIVLKSDSEDEREK